MPNLVKGIALAGSDLTITYLDDTTAVITLPSGGGGGGGGQTAQQVQDAIRTEIAKLTIPAPITALRPLWALVAGVNSPPTPAIPVNKLLPAGDGFTAENVVVAPWGQARPNAIPDGQTLWMVSVIILADNSTIVGPPQAVHELSTADRTALDGLAALVARVAVNDAKRGAAIWAQDGGDGARTIPDIAIPSSIARDTELSELVDGATLLDGLLTLTRKDGNNPIQIRIFPAGGNDGQILKRVSGELAWAADNSGTGGGGSGAPDSITSVTVGIVGGQTQITTRTRGGSSNAYVLRLVPETDSATAGDVLTIVGNSYEWRTPAALPDLSTYATIARVNADLATRDSEIGNLSAIVFANALPQSLRDLAPDVRVIKHPAGRVGADTGCHGAHQYRRRIPI